MHCIVAFMIEQSLLKNRELFYYCVGADRALAEEICDLLLGEKPKGIREFLNSLEEMARRHLKANSEYQYSEFLALPLGKPLWALASLVSPSWGKCPDYCY